MDSTISVSKGCFVFKNHVNQKPRKSKTVEHNVQHNERVYLKTLEALMKDIEKLKEEWFSEPLPRLVEYVKNSYNSDDIQDVLPAAALLTNSSFDAIIQGINQPDQQNQFMVLAKHIKEKTSAKVCTLQSSDCMNLKNAVETMVFSFIESESNVIDARRNKELKRSQCTMRLLSEWYEGGRSGNDKPALVVILPDFECLNVQVFQDFVVILHLYCSKIPIVLILGVATAVSVLHSALPYHITSKVCLKIFKTTSTTLIMDQIFENIVISPKFVFRLSSTAIKLLTHIFLCYDFSLSGLIKGLKYCVMEHFFQSNIYALCTDYYKSVELAKNMSHDDLEAIRQIMSFRPYVESTSDKREIISLLTDDNYLRMKLPNLLLACQLYFINFRIFIEFLTFLVEDLPNNPMGKLRRDIYVTCMSKDILQESEFKECMQIISLMSKDVFINKISKAVEQTRKFLNSEISGLELGSKCQQEVNKKLIALEEHLELVRKADYRENKQNPASLEIKNLTRHNLKENLLKLAKQDKPISQLNMTINQTVQFICNEIIAKYLISLKYAPPLHEIFVLNDCWTVRRNIIGAPRAALHTALNNPHFYLQCDCCVLEADTQLVPTLPDLSIVYKLHLECGKMINLFDWLQAYRTVVDTNEEECEQIDPKIQARFARAVAELQFLGYIKSTKRKTDHVARLTW